MMTLTRVRCPSAFPQLPTIMARTVKQTCRHGAWSGKRWVVKTRVWKTSYRFNPMKTDNLIAGEACSEHTGSAQHSACHGLNSRPREAGGDGAVQCRVGVEKETVLNISTAIIEPNVTESTEPVRKARTLERQAHRPVNRVLQERKRMAKAVRRRWGLVVVLVVVCEMRVCCAARCAARHTRDIFYLQDLI
jgi:hypothetical protein